MQISLRLINQLDIFKKSNIFLDQIASSDQTHYKFKKKLNWIGAFQN